MGELWPSHRAELQQGDPLIVGALGHATVLTAIKYSRYRSNRRISFLSEITVRDPWPNSPNRRNLTANEIVASFFVAKVTVHAS
jgi:hypothetical protein